MALGYIRSTTGLGLRDGRRGTGSPERSGIRTLFQHTVQHTMGSLTGRLTCTEGPSLRGLNGTPEWIRTTDLLLRRQRANAYVVVFSVGSLVKLAEIAERSARFAHKLHTSSVWQPKANRTNTGAKLAVSLPSRASGTPPETGGTAPGNGPWEPPPPIPGVAPWWHPSRARLGRVHSLARFGGPRTAP